ncbi:uncharacterized protein Achl [Calliphora vicina]|uniref:uncharacterized protein Achl n=1 Tax=Calliphora vicina TaxID=7373 RepID=UPI00325BED5C
MPQPEEVIQLVAAADNNNDTCEIRSQHIKNGHTFLVTTVRTETITTTTETNLKESEQLKAVPIMQKPIEAPAEEKPCCSSSCSSPDNSTKAIVPLSSSLPSKLLRFHAKRSAQALLQRLESQEQSIDSQFDSDEGLTAGYSGCSSNNGEDYISQASCDSLDNLPEPSAPPMSPPPPRNSPSTDNTDEKIDVGMGSSIEGSEESEEDDELKPLAVDNHVLHEIDLRAINTTTTLSSTTPITTAVLEAAVEKSLSNTAVLSEANLEKFRKHQSVTQTHPIMDNIYLHPNFKYDFNAKEQIPENPLKPADTAISATALEQKRVHRSFLTMKKSEPIAEKANSVVSQATSASGDKTLINEIDNLDPALIPSEEMAAEITDAVEYYFSNDSILKDAFLLKHVKRNKEGFVSLKLVSSFKRVRQLTKDWKVVGNAVRRKSHKIELNDVGTKVRRVDALPNFDETMPSRTIVACDLPLDKLSIEKVSDIFSKCGEIALIRILKPGMAIPVDVRQFMNKYPEMQQKECALVEYLESSSAREARNLQGPFKVFEMVAPKKKTGKKAVIQVSAPVVRMVENYRYFNDHNYERTRGGSFSGVPVQDVDLRYRLKRNNSDFAAKAYGTDVHHSFGPTAATPHYHHSSPTYATSHRGSFGSEHHQPQHQHHQHHQQSHHEPSAGRYQSRGSIIQDITSQTPSSPGTQSNFFAYTPRRYSNTSTISTNTANNNSINNIDSSMTAKPTHTNLNNISNNTGNTHNLARRLSNCSQEGYADAVRRSSNCSENAPQRRDSNCSDNCPCTRRISDFGQTEVYRKTSQGSIGSGGERRFSNGSMQFERTFSNGSDISNNFHRRPSADYNLERKQSLETQTGSPYDDPNVGGGGGGYNVFPRRYSNNFNNSNNISSKLAAYDNAQYINGRRISTDSGYDRRFSFGSEYEGSPRSRTNSFLNNYKHGLNDYDGQPRSRTGSFLDGSPRSRSGSFAQRTAEHLVRTPIGPDGSKGFGSRARKFEQTISPV